MSRIRNVLKGLKPPNDNRSRLRQIVKTTGEKGVGYDEQFFQGNRPANAAVDTSSYLTGRENINNTVVDGGVEALKGVNQPWSHQMAIGIPRTIANIVMGTIGQTAAALDFEDYANSDKEVGNWITRAMMKGQEAVREALPIHRTNPNKPLDLADSGWWFDNGYSLIESIASFAATGGIMAKGLSTVSRAVRAQKLAATIGASNAEVAKNAFGTVSNAMMLNQAEAILEANDVYEEVYRTVLGETGNERVARQKAADGASTTIAINRLNIPLNLTSANLFFRTPKATRRLLDNPYGQATVGRGLLEGGQESIEENINMIASNKGKAVGLDQEYTMKNVIADITSPEGAEAALLGFLGGMGQTVLTGEGINRIRKTVDPETGKKISVRDYNVQQYEKFSAHVKELESVLEKEDIGEFTAVLKAVVDQEKIKKAAVKADELGDTEKANEYRKLLLASQAYTAFKRGTTKHLIDLYEALGKGEQKTGMADNYKEKAAEAVAYIKHFEDIYNDTQQYANPEAVYYNRARSYELNKEYKQAKYNLAEFDANLADVTERMIETNEINREELGEDFMKKKSFDNTAHEELVKKIKSSPEYKQAEKTRKEVKKLGKKLNELDTEYTDITSGEFQEKIKEVRAKVQEELKKKLAKITEEKEKEAVQEEADRLKAEKIAKQEADAEATRLAEEKAKEEKEELANKIKHYSVGDTVNITPAMSKEFGKEGATGTVLESFEGTVTIQDDATGKVFSITEEGLTKEEPKPSEEEDDGYSTEGGEDHKPITAEEVAKNDPALNPKIKQPQDGGAKVVSTKDKGGEYLDFIKEQYPLLIEYERTPIDKKNRQVTFEINDNVKVLNDKQKAALKDYQEGNFTDEAILRMVEYLPINVVFRKEKGERPKINGPLEVLPYTNANGAQDNFNNYTRYLRANIVNALAKGAKPEDIKGSIQDQYKGLLQIDPTIKGNPERENPIHDLHAFKGDMNKVQIFMVDDNGNLVDPQGKIVKHGFRGKGEIYTVIPQANGEPFYLKLNVRKINQEEAEILYELYRQRMTDADTKINTTLGMLPEGLQERIKKAFGPTEEQLTMPREERPYLTPLELIGKRMKDITVRDITNFLIYDGSRSSKSQVRLHGARLLYGPRKIFKNRIELEANKNDFIKFLVNKKRHHIKYRLKPKDTNRSIHAANREYVNYLLATRTLNTNAVVGHDNPTFKGRTQIYLHLDVEYNNETIGTKHDPNQARPVKEKTSPKDIDEVPVTPQKLSEEAQIREQWVNELQPFQDRYDALKAKIDAGNGEPGSADGKTPSDEARLESLGKHLDNRDAYYVALLEEKGYTVEFDEVGPEEKPKVKPMVVPEGTAVQVYKDKSSSWTLRVADDGKVYNMNTGDEVTSEKIINKAHLKSGYVKYQKVTLDNGTAYAITDSGKIINITKAPDGTPSPSSGKKISPNSSFGKEALKKLNERVEVKERVETPVEATEESIREEYEADAGQQENFDDGRPKVKRGAKDYEVPRLTYGKALGSNEVKIFKVKGVPLDSPTKSWKFFTYKEPDGSYTVAEESTGGTIANNARSQKEAQELLDKKYEEVGHEGFRKAIEGVKGGRMDLIRQRDERLAALRASKAKAKPKTSGIELTPAEELVVEMLRDKKMIHEFTSEEQEILNNEVSIERREELKEMLEENPDLFRKSPKKFVPLHEVKGTPEHEAKEEAEREEPKEELPTPPEEIQKEKDEMEKPQEQCGPPKMKPLTPAERAKRDKKRRGKK